MGASTRSRSFFRRSKVLSPPSHLMFLGPLNLMQAHTATALLCSTAPCFLALLQKSACSIIREVVVLCFHFSFSLTPTLLPISFLPSHKNRKLCPLATTLCLAKCVSRTRDPGFPCNGHLMFQTKLIARCYCNSIILSTLTKTKDKSW